MAQPALVCPICRGELARQPSGSVRCGPCRCTYPEVAGIPDLRVGSDRYISLEEDRAKAERLAERDDLSFTDLVAEYWRLTPEVPSALAARYRATASDAVRRATAFLDGESAAAPGSGDAVLDVGCGTGGLVVAAARRGADVTGVDLALRWLVVARRRCQDEGVEARLVAADGALLPFRGASFDRTYSLATVEHAADQRGLLQSCLLSVRPGGYAHLVVANRFSLAPEPVTGLLGVGCLPRRLAVPYVRRRRRTRYQFVRPLSPSELRSLIGLRDDVSVGPGPLPTPPHGAARPRQLVQASYERLRCRRLARAPLTWFGPFLEVTGRVS